MPNNKLGIFSVLLFATVLLIPATSLADANASGKKDDRYYDEKRYYYEDDRYYDERDPYYYNDDYYPEPGKLVVKKELYQCFNTPENNTGCFEKPVKPKPGQPPTSIVVGPDSPLYQDCSDPQVECRYNVEDFKIDIVTGLKITGSTEGEEVTLSGKEYFVEEDDVRTNYIVEQSCKNSGYEQGGVIGFRGVVGETGVCIIYEGDCSGELEYNDYKECTIKNYLPVDNTIIKPQPPS